MPAKKRTRSSPEKGQDANCASATDAVRFLVDIEGGRATATLLCDLQSKLHATREEAERLAAQHGKAGPASALLVRELTEVAARLLRHAAIVATAGDGKTTVFLLRELELYCHYPRIHPDTFTHCDVQQTIFGTWYFHKKGGTYKSGSFKGLDITAGFEQPNDLPPATSEDKAHPSTSIPAIGFLIRSVQQLRQDGEACQPHEGGLLFRLGAALPDEGLVEGPSLTVDAILAATQSKTIAALVGSSSYLTVSSASKKGDSKSGPNLRLVALQPLLGEAALGPELPSLVYAPRVGLIPRTAPDLTYAGRLYRFISSWPGNAKSRHLAKHRSGIVSGIATTALHRLTAEARSLPELSSGTHRSSLLEELREKSGATKQNCEAILDLVTSAWKSLIIGKQEVGAICRSSLGGDVHKSEVIAPIVVAAFLLCQ